MSEKLPVSVYIITKNCEATLALTLASVRDCAEVVLVDSGSTDRTLEIARAQGCRIWHQDWLGYARQKALALSYCTQDWVLNLDGDEEASAELLADIAACIASDDADGLDIPIHDYFLGCPPAKNGRYNHRVRFFRKSAGSYDTGKEVHESITVTGKVRTVAGGIRHYGENTIRIKVDKTNAYSALAAAEKFAKGKQHSLVKLVLVMPLMFFKSYILRRNFLNGRRGFIGSMINAFYAFLKEAKLYELHLNRRLQGGKTSRED